jgi:hypothetical protein
MRRFLNNLISAAAVTAGLTYSDLAIAQHSDVLVLGVDGRLAAVSESGDNLDLRVFEGFLGEGAFADEPGFESISTTTGTVPPGTTALPGVSALAGDFLPMKIGGLVSNLFYWDGAATSGDSIPFEAPPTTDYSFSIFGLEGARAAADGSASLVTGTTIAITAADGGMHEDPAYFLDDDRVDDNEPAPAEGVYLVALRLRMEGLNRSAPLLMVWGSPTASVAAVESAVEWVDERAELLAPDLAADFDGDLDVDGADFLTWQQHVGATGDALQIHGDADGDGAVTAADLDTLRSEFGGSLDSFPGVTNVPAAAVPEPSAAAMVTLATLGAVARRRRGVP